MFNRIRILSVISIISALALASCSAEQPTPVMIEVTKQVLQTVVVTQLVEVQVVVTATPQPATATPLPSPTFPLMLTPLSEAGQPTSYPLILTPLSENGLPPIASGNAKDVVADLPPEVSYWCLPQTGVPAPAEYSPIPPQNAVKAQLINSLIDYRGSFIQCTFVYDFKSPVPTGAKLEISDKSNSVPFLSSTLTPDPANPNKAYTLISHSMLTAPPAWETLYQFNISSASSSSVWTSGVHYDRGWRATICWTGLLPNPTTLHCPLQQDPHSGDPGYIHVPTEESKD